MRRSIYFSIFLVLFQYLSCFATRKLIFIPRGQSALPAYKGKIWKTKTGSREAIGYYTKGNKKLVVGFHGQHGTIHSFGPIGQKFVVEGYSVLLIEYPGYGLSKGTSSESNIYNDSEYLIKDVQGKEKFTVNDTILLGYSLGTGVAVEMAKKKLGGKVILLAPYTSIPAVASERFIPVLPYFLIWDRFSTFSKADEVNVPVLILHGKKDKIVPYYMGEELQKKFPNAMLWGLSGYDHWLYGALQGQIWNNLLKFINDVTAKSKK